MPYGFSIWDDDYSLVLCNARYSEIYGLPPERIHVGMSLLAICELTIAAGNHPDVMPDELFRIYRDRLRANCDPAQVGRYDKLIRERTIRTSYTRTPGLGWVVIHEDISEDIRRIEALRARESELSQQNMRLAAAVNNMPQGLSMFDANRRLVICNDKYVELHGLPPDLLRPGTLFTDILAYRADRDPAPLGGGQAFIRAQLDLAARRDEARATTEFHDGRVIAVLHHPMADGGWVSSHQDITEQRSTEMRIRRLARHDPLTDLPNRLVFQEKMKAAEARIRHGQVMAVLAVDLDHFKAVNDTLGHAVGDAVLKMVADRLRGSCRESDVVARLGGDEFAVLTDTLTEPEDAALLAERVVRQIAEPFVYDGQNVMIGASVGITVAPGDGADPDTLLQNADLALYRAKGDGRGAYHFFEPGMDAALQTRRVLELELRRAIAEGQFRLVFQPLFSLERNRVAGLEALIRWYHPTRGTIAPAEFVPVAEETGLIVPIGEWVLGEACAAAAGWPDDVVVTVNVSAAQFRHRTLLQHVRAALARSHLPPRRLELELSESVLYADPAPNLDILRRLHEIGVRVSVDHFGTGSSMLSYLRAFPFDRIKIDRSLVHDLSCQGSGALAAKAIIDLGRNLGIATSAAGVETEDQLARVRERGCSEAQGFLFSPPLPAAAVDKLFAEGGGLERAPAPETAAG